MLELEILLDQLCHSSIDVGKLVVAVHGIGISAGRLSVAVDSLGYSIDRSHIIRHGEEKEEAYQKKSCSDRHHSRDDTPVEAGIEVLGVGLEILVDQLIELAQILDEGIIFRLKGTEEPRPGVNRISKKHFIKLKGSLHKIVEGRNHSVEHRKSIL
jgi:hypothetical protein